MLFRLLVVADADKREVIIFTIYGFSIFDLRIFDLRITDFDSEGQSYAIISLRQNIRQKTSKESVGFLLLLTHLRYEIDGGTGKV